MRILSFLSFLVLFSSFGFGSTLKDALNQYEQKDYKSAKASFQELLKNNQFPANASEKQKVAILILGNVYISFLGQIDFFENKPRKACKTLHKINENLSSLPSGWRNLNINPRLLSYMDNGEKAYLKCANVPSIIQITNLPKNAQVTYLPIGAEKWLPTTAPMKTTLSSFLLQIKTKEYETITKTINLPDKWAKISMKLQFTKKEVLLVKIRIKDKKAPDLPPARFIDRSSFPAIVIGGLSAVAAVTAIIIVANTFNQEPSKNGFLKTNPIGATDAKTNALKVRLYKNIP